MQHAIDFLCQKNPIFKTILDTYGVPQIPMRPQGFETLVLLILEQQVSIDSAKATFQKIKLNTVDLKPETLASISDEGFRSLGVSRQKTSYIKGLAKAILNKELDIERFPHQTQEEVRATLIKMKGIGNWTIDVYLMFCLQSADIIPLGDIAVINTIKELFDVHDKSAIELLTQQWSPHRSLATFLLWHHYLQKRNRTVTY